MVRGLQQIKCYKCKKHYPSNFIITWEQPRNNGVMNMCRDCLSARQKKYAKTESGKLATNNASKRAYLKHKEKWLARAKARYAISKGIIIKPKKCKVCEIIKPLQGHHENYSKPLEVIFLCSGCHATADKCLESLIK